MDGETTKEELEKCVLRILKHGDMNLMTESKVRKLAAEETGCNLQDPANRSVVKRVVEDFFLALQQSSELQPSGKAAVIEKRRPPPPAARPPAAKPAALTNRRRTLILDNDEDGENEDDRASPRRPPRLERSSGRRGYDEESEGAEDENDEERDMGAKRVKITSNANNVVPGEKNSFRPQEGDELKDDEKTPKDKKRKANYTGEEVDVSEEQEQQLRGKAKRRNGRRPAHFSDEEVGSEEGSGEEPVVRFRQKKQPVATNQQQRARNAGPEMDAYDDEDEAQSKARLASKELNDDGDLVICQLSKTRTVTIQEFNGKLLVSIREYYLKDGKMKPTPKGISLTVEQWDALKKGIPKVESAIKRLRR